MTKLTKDYINGLVQAETYARPDNSTLTVCVLRLSNGCTVTGTSNVIDPSTFDVDLGKLAAREDAIKQVCELEAYAIKREGHRNILKACHAVHAANRVLQVFAGEKASLPWEQAPEYQRKSTLDGVIGMLRDPARTPQQSHAAWMEAREADGWTYGEVKDEAAKTHPCMVPYDDLPAEQRIKDTMFLAVARAVMS